MNHLYSYIMVVLFCALTACGHHDNSKYKSVEIHTSSLHEILHFTGTVQPLHEITLTSPFEGILENVHYPFGQHVKKGQIVFTLNSASLQKQYNDALTEYLKAKDNFAITKAKFTGTEELWKAGLISKNNYMSETSNLNTTHVTLMQSLHALSALLAKTGEQTTEKLTELNLADFEKVQNALSTQHHIIRFKAPINGVVLYPPLSNDMKANHLMVGSTVKAGQALALIGDLSGIRIEIDIPEIDIDKIKPNLSATVHGVAFNQQELKGTLKSITSQAAMTSTSTLPSFQATIEVTSLTPEQQAWIKVGMSATVDLDVTRDEQLMVPIAAVYLNHGKSFVRIRALDGTIIEKRVHTGTSKADSVAILDGLKDGDVVIYE